MRLFSKIAIVNVIIIILTVITTLTIVVNDILDNSTNTIANVKDEEFSQTKVRLKNIVDIGYEFVAANYALKNDPQYLINNYSHTIQEALNSCAAKLVKDPKNAGITEVHSTAQVMIFKTNDPNIPEPWLSFLQNLKPGSIGGINLIKVGTDIVPAGYKKIPNTDLVVCAAIKPEQIISDIQEKVKQNLRKMLYDNGRGYIFVNDMSCRSIVHPFKLEIEGTDFTNITDSKGKKHVAAMVEICTSHKQGYLTYYWPKHEKNLQNPPIAEKLSYVRLFEPWGWIVGSGDYVDNIAYKTEMREREVRQQVNELITKVLVSAGLITLGMVLFSIVFAATMTVPMVKLIKAMESSDLENLSKSALPTLGGSLEIKKLGQIFNKMLSSIHGGIDKMRENTITKEKIESEMEIARKIQLSLLPQTFPSPTKNTEFKIFGHISAARSVGGDLYDFFYLDEQHICFAVGDVSGKGVPAALFMTLTKTLLRAKSKPTLSAGKIVTAMNKLLCENNDMSMFVSFFLGILNLQTGKLNYCNAGHNLPHLLRKDRKVETMPVRHGIPLGIMDNEPYYDDSFTLKSGDLVLLYTDGVARGQNYLHQMFGEVRMQPLLRQLINLSPQECVQKLHAEVMEFIGNTEQDDDIAILALQFIGTPHGYKTVRMSKDDLAAQSGSNFSN